MGTLNNQQFVFTKLVGELIAYAYSMGYTLTFADAYRDPAMAEIYAKQGRGIRNSLHTLRLAVDFNLFKSGALLMTTEDHRPLGEWWERRHPLCRWGGRFGDGNHYSMEWNGVK